MLSALLALPMAMPAATAAADASADMPVPLQVDGERSDVGFSLRVLFRHLSGRFLSLRGRVMSRPGGDTVDLDITVDALSVWMPKESHARWARSEEFFDASHFPHIRFNAREVPMRTVREGGLLRGEVGLRGHMLPVDVRLLSAGCEHPGRDCPVRAEAAVSRAAFGMTSKRLVVGDRVDLAFSIVLRPERAAPAAVAEIGTSAAR